CLPIDEELKELVKYRYDDWVIKEPKYKRQVLIRVKDYIKVGLEGDELNRDYLKYLDRLVEWNKAHPKQQIASLTCEADVHDLKLCLKMDEYLWGTEEIVIQDYIMNTSIEQVENFGLLGDLFMRQKINSRGTLVRWLLTNEPSFVANNIIPITQYLLNTIYRQHLISLWLHMKNYVHLGIPQRLCSICKDVFDKPSYSEEELSNQRWGPNKIECAMIALSVLMNPQEFLLFIAPYYPSELTVDISSKEGQYIYKVQKAIAVAVKKRSVETAIAM
ncbi:MAG: hypothetical protein QXJ27_07875, partial [Thermoplasmata archaeon]